MSTHMTEKADIAEKLRSQIGDDIQSIYSREALIAEAAKEIGRLRGIEVETEEAHRIMKDQTQMIRQLRKALEDFIKAYETHKSEPLVIACENARNVLKDWGEMK